MKCRAEPLTATFLQEEIYVVEFKLRMVRNNITYHKRVRAANSAPSIMRYCYVLATLESTYCVFSDRDKYSPYGFLPYRNNLETLQPDIIKYKCFDQTYGKNRSL
jgi:hypothetical protein